MAELGSPSDHLADLGGLGTNTQAFWTPERVALRDWLNRYAPAISPLYSGALELAALDSFPGRVHFIAHAIREIRNRLPNTLGPKVKSRREHYEHLAEKIRKAWIEDRLPKDGRLVHPDETMPSTSGHSRLEVSVELLTAVGQLIKAHDEAQANQTTCEKSSFLALSDQGHVPPYVVKNWNKLYDDIHGFAHVGYEPLPVEADLEWVDKFFEFEKILMYLSKRRYENLDDLDELLKKANAMNSWAAPSKAELDQLAALATQAENRTYFFNRLENPEWVSLLAQHGFFAEPPNPVPGDEPGFSGSRRGLKVSTSRGWLLCHRPR